MLCFKPSSKHNDLGRPAELVVSLLNVKIPYFDMGCNIIVSMNLMENNAAPHLRDLE